MFKLCSVAMVTFKNPQTTNLVSMAIAAASSSFSNVDYRKQEEPITEAN